MSDEGTVYSVLVKYWHRGPTGHCVRAASAEEALDVANRHRVGNPMGSDDGVRDRRVLWPASPERIERRERGRGGRIWREEGGALVAEKVRG